MLCIYSWNYEKKVLNYFTEHFLDYLANENGSTIFLQPSDKEETANIISSLNSCKASGPNGTYYRTLFF